MKLKKTFENTLQIFLRKQKLLQSNYNFEQNYGNISIGTQNINKVKDFAH